MKKLMLFITLLVCVTSCDCELCYDEDGSRHVSSKKANVIYFGNLSFYEEKLFGTWGCTDLWFGNEQVKEIVIKAYGLANIQLQEARGTKRYNRTYRYQYSGKYLTFAELEENRGYQFKIVDYLPGSMFLQDSKGIHEVRLYSVCSGY